MPTGIGFIAIRTVSEMWTYIKRYLPYGILAALVTAAKVSQGICSIWLWKI